MKGSGSLHVRKLGLDAEKNRAMDRREKYRSQDVDGGDFNARTGREGERIEKKESRREREDR